VNHSSHRRRRRRRRRDKRGGRRKEEGGERWEEGGERRREERGGRRKEREEANPDLTRSPLSGLKRMREPMVLSMVGLLLCATQPMSTCALATPRAEPRHVARIHAYSQKLSKRASDGFKEQGSETYVNSGATTSWLGNINLIPERQP